MQTSVFLYLGSFRKNMFFHGAWVKSKCSYFGGKQCFSVLDPAIIWVRFATPFVPAELFTATELGCKIKRTFSKRRWKLLRRRFRASKTAIRLAANIPMQPGNVVDRNLQARSTLPPQPSRMCNPQRVSYGRIHPDRVGSSRIGAMNWCGAGFQLLYRRLPAGCARAPKTAFRRQETCGLEIPDTPGWKPALRLGIQLRLSSWLPPYIPTANGHLLSAPLPFAFPIPQRAVPAPLPACGGTSLISRGCAFHNGQRV